MRDLSERELWQFHIQTHRKHTDEHLTWNDWCLKRGIDERIDWEE